MASTLFRRESDMAAGLATLFFLLLWLTAAGGWIANVVKFVAAISGPTTTLEIVRGIGIVFAPLGSVLGFI